MRYVITSDVHLGSRHCRAELFSQCIQTLADDVCLVLGGDIIDDPLQSPLPADHQTVLNQLIDRATGHEVHWIFGNHDDGYRPEGTEPIHFHSEFAIDNRLYITHGDRFDNVMPRYGWFLWAFKRLHMLRMQLGAHPVHVAKYAKRFKPFYAFLRRTVARNAIEHARENGFGAVACGHVHYPDDYILEGIRYVNLGSWTEDTPYCLLVDKEQMALKPFDKARKTPGFFK